MWTNISGAMIRQGLKNSKLAFSGSIFRSTIAKLIYDNYCVNDDIVYDYSCGFGQRFLGAMASKHNLKYIGAEPWTKSFESLNKMARFLNYQHKTEIYNVGLENFIEDKYINQISLAFSSPPYFDTEIYCNESTQCNLNDFQYYLHYWNKTCENIYLLLKKDGKFIINISNLYKDDLLQIALEHKFTLIDTLHLKYRSFSKEKLEPVLVLQK
jgi:tRNA1(Val) A37 N6-methylase TrmN6